MDPLELAANNGLPALDFVDPNDVGLSAVSSDDFMTLLITQLQYQDPTEPVSNDQILQQVSQMQSMQASIELTDTLEGLANGSALSSASSMIGQVIRGRDAAGSVVEGVVDRATLRDGAALLTVGDAEVSLDRVESIAQPTAQTP